MAGASEREVAIAADIVSAMQSYFSRHAAKGARIRGGHAKSHGCVRGSLAISAAAPAALKHGIFACAETYPVLMRFSSASPLVRDDHEPDLRAAAIKVYAPRADGARPEGGEASIQDFTMLSAPVHPARNAEEFSQLIKLGLAGSPVKFFFTGPPARWRIASLLATARYRSAKVPSPLSARYWSVTPFQLGDAIVKFSLAPAAGPGSQDLRREGADFLHDNLRALLRAGPAAFDFLVQVRADDMPVDDISRRWDEARAPFLPLGRLTIPQQDFVAELSDPTGDGLAFDAANGESIVPVGEINRVRGYVYRQMAQFRKAFAGDAAP